MKISLFTKIDKPTVKECIEYVKEHFNSVSVYQGKIGNPFPLEAYNNSPDIVFSYLSPWIIPQKILNKTKLWNINFHPAPPEYPGTGCFNFALYNNEKMYGVTAHHMEEKIDTGKLIAIKRFPIVDSDSVYSLSIKSYIAMFSLFIEIVDGIITNKSLPAAADTWKRIPYMRRELEELCKVTIDMEVEEIRRRIRATTYPGMPGAYIEVSGYKFSYNPDR